MPRFSVSKSVLINASVDTVHASVRDFRQWGEWSPWLIAEPGCSVEFSDDGLSYSWDGKIVGSGGMEIIGEEKEPDREICYRLTFLKPWKSVSDVAFRFSEKDGGTEVTWTMDGSLPFFLFWMKGMMTSMIGMDYQRGLAMLKDYIETGGLPFKMEFVGTESFKGFRYCGVRASTAMAEIEASMGRDFEKLQAAFKSADLCPAGGPFSIYHKWNLGKGTAEYTIGYPVQSNATVPAGLVEGTVPDCEVYSIRHTGPYRHLGNPWAAGMFHARAKVFRQSRKLPPFETYENDPAETPESDLITVVRFPVR